MTTHKKINLISPELQAEFIKFGTQSEEQDPMVLAKFFNPSGAGTWYAISYDAESRICFGYVTGLGFDEYGYFSIDELESLRVPPFGLSIERDIHFTPCPMSQILKDEAS